MAQIKKFDGGGTFSFNGQTFNYDDYSEFFEQQALNGNHNAAIIVAAKKKNPNQHVSISSRDNTFVLDGVDKEVYTENGMNEGTYNSVNNRNSFLRQLIRRRSGNDYIRDGLELGLQLKDKLSAKSTEKPEETPTYDYTFTGDSKVFKYDDQGRLINDPDNMAIWDEWHLLENYYNATPEERKRYDISRVKDGINKYVKWREAQEKLEGEGYNSKYGFDVWDRASKTKDGLGDDFYNIYDFLGYKRYGTSTDEEVDLAAQEEAALNAKLDTLWANSGYDRDTFEDYLTFDENGNMGFTQQGANILNGLINTYGKNIIFNDAFVSHNPTLDWLHGYVLYNNKLYDQNDLNNPNSILYKKIHENGGFYDLNKAGQWEASDKLFKWNYDNIPGMTTHNEPYLGFDQLSNTYDLTNYVMPSTIYNNGEKDLNLNDLGYQVVRYMDPNGEVDRWGYQQPLYAITDTYGRPIYKGLSNEDFTGGLWIPNENEKDQHALRRNKYAFIQQKDSPWNGWIKDTFLSRVKPDGSSSFDVYTSWNEKGEPQYRLVINDKYFRGSNMENYAYDNVPIEVINALSKSFSKGDQNKHLIRLRNLIDALTSTGWRDFWRNSANLDDLQALGLNAEEATALLNYFAGANGERKSEGKAFERRNKYGVQIPINKKGGILKYQHGGYNAGEAEIEPKTLALDPEDVNYFKDSAKMSEQFSGADWAEIASVGADVLGAVASLVPGYGDVAGLALGAAGSITQLGADLARPGNVGRDFTRFAKNVGLDVVSAIPFIGEAVGLPQAAARVGKLSKFLSPIFISAGLGSAASAVDKAFKGEELTVEDWANLAAGFQAVLGTGAGLKNRYNKSKIAALVSKKNAGKIPTYKYKIPGTDKTVTLSQTEVETLQTKKPKEAQKYLQTLVKNQAGEGIEVPEVSLEDFGLTQKGNLWWKSVEGKPVENERKTAGFFFGRGLDSYLNAHAQDVKTIIPTLPGTTTSTRTRKIGKAIETAEVVTPPNTSTARAAAGVLYRNGIDFPMETYGFGLKRVRLAPTYKNKTYKADIDDIRGTQPLMISAPNYTAPSVTKVQVRGKVNTAQTPSVISTGPISSVPQSPTAKYLDQRSGIIRYTPKAKLNERISRLQWNAVSTKDIVAKLSRAKTAEEFWGVFDSLSKTKQKSVMNYLEKSKAKTHQGLLNKFARPASQSAASVTKSTFDKHDFKSQISRIQTKEDFEKFVQEAKNNNELIAFLLKNPRYFEKQMKAAMRRANLKGSRVKSYRDYFRDLGVTLFKEGGVVKAKDGIKVTINDDGKGLRMASWEQDGEVYWVRVDEDGYQLDDNGNRVSDYTLEEELNGTYNIDAATVSSTKKSSPIISTTSVPQSSEISSNVTEPISINNRLLKHNITKIPIQSIKKPDTSFETKMLQYNTDPSTFVRKRAEIIRTGTSNPTFNQPQLVYAKKGGVLKAAGGTVLDKRDWSTYLQEAAKIEMAVAASNRQRNLSKQMRDELQQFGPVYEPEVHSSFSTFGVDGAHRANANSVLSNPAVSTDYGTNYAYNQENLRNYNNAMLEGSLKTSELFSNYKGENVAADRYYAKSHTETANAWNQFQGSLIAGDYQEEGSHQAQVNQALQTGITNMQNIANTRSNARKEAENQIFKIDQAIIQAKKQNPNADTSSLESMKSYIMKQHGIKFAKKGTKLRPAHEQIWIDQEKATRKAIQKLSDNAVKFILNALK